MAAPKYSVLQIRPAKDSLVGQAALIEFLSSLKSSLKAGFMERLLGTFETISLEIANLNQTTFFVIACPARLEHLIRSQIAAQYPTALITPMRDYLPEWLGHGQASVGQLTLTGPSYLPLNSTLDDKVDQMASILGGLSRVPATQAAVVQICLFAAPSNWQKAIRSVVDKGIPSPDPLKPPSPHPQKALIEKKLLYQSFACDIRLAAITPSLQTSSQLLSQLAAAFGTYALSEGNSLALKVPKQPVSVAKLRQMILERSAKYSNQYQFLNYSEITALFHLPGVLLAPIKGIAWGKTLKGEAPQNLPVDEGIPDSQQYLYNFFAQTEYKNHLAVFGMRKGIDRLRHTYILGKSGTGKSTLIGRMAVNDIQHGEGIAFVDPHGDAAEILLDYIPENRIQDVAYLDPSVPGKSFWMNPLFVKTPAHGELVASSIVSIFSKLYGNSWGPRLEYILRNTLLTLVYKPETTLADVPRILTNKDFREKECLIHVTDPVLINFWRDEYDKYSEKFQTEAIAPILNKVGQFITSPTIRDIINHPRSTVDFEEMMNSGKIIILNLPQGKIGEDNAALLGAMFISQIQIAAMNRAHFKEEDRREFFLYVDEFQNFATSSFVKILSEARKYKLGLILANQYIAQLPEEIQNAIFGNVGTVMSYVVGAQDADRVVKELNSLYTPDDLVGLARYQLAMKMSIDSQVSQPFSANALPLPSTQTHQKEKVLAATHAQYYRETKPMDMSQVTSLMTPPAKRYTEPAYALKALRDPSSSNQPTTSVIPGLTRNPSASSPAMAGLTPRTYIPQLPPIAPRTRPNPFKIPPSASPVGAAGPVTPLQDPSLSDLDDLRKQGFRPSVVGCFLNNQKILLAYQKSFNQWLLPQGGVENKQGLRDAFFRELAEEVTEDFLNVCDKDIRLIAVDKIEFPPSKYGLRDMTTDTGEPVVMKGKYYYFFVSSAKTTDITLKATEFDDIKWLNFDEAYKLIKETNTGGRLRMTNNILHLLKDQGLLSTNQPTQYGSDPAQRPAPSRSHTKTGQPSSQSPTSHPRGGQLHSTSRLGAGPSTQTTPPATTSDPFANFLGNPSTPRFSHPTTPSSDDSQS